jgi:CRISPR system subtype II-B RNA-guided endonuclease Cas9/Csx12
MSSVYTCSVGLDLGAKCTGAFIVARGKNEPVDARHTKALAIVTSDNITFDMKNRTLVRSRLRAGKRSKLARRLMMLIMKEQLQKAGIALSAEENRRLLEAVFGLMKRRGYYYIETESDLTALEGLNTSVFANVPALADFFPYEEDLAEVWLSAKEDIELLRGLQAALPSEDEFSAFLEAGYGGVLSEEKQESYKNALSVMAHDTKVILAFVATGDQHRTKYLKAIREDIDRDTRLIPLVKAFGGADRFWRFLGNLGNLHLRVFRWYFNNKAFQKEDRWIPKDFQAAVVRGFRYMHPAKDNTRKHLDLIRTFEEADDIVECFCSLDPVRTIPPYEDQNNRRPPVDQTLLLNPAALNRRFGNRWLIWAQRFELNDPAVAEELDEIVPIIDRKSRRQIAGNTVLSNNFYRSSYVLQRVLYRSRAFSDLDLRLLSVYAAGQRKELEKGNLRNDLLSQRARKAKARLSAVLGSQHVAEFLLFAADYYDEAELSRFGVWYENEGSLLEVSGIHPPAKRNILPRLVANILMVTEDAAERFMKEVWHSECDEHTVAWYCEKIWETLKEKRNEFNLLYQRALSEQRASGKKKLSAETKALLTVGKRVNLTASFIGKELGLSESHVAKFKNPYSLGQLYSLIETKRSGSTRISRAVHKEQAWRMRMTEVNGELAANCSRLPADSVRPFDGVVRRLLDRQAWELTKVLAELIRSKVSFRNGVVHVPLIVEKNIFRLMASIDDFKKRAEKKKVSERAEAKAEAAYEKHFHDKEARIKAASQGICPYTGNALGNEGEIDHILPKSTSLKIFQMVLNNEANLIYVSKAGNMRKGDKRYTLEDLHPNYLRKVFGTENRTRIQAEIRREVKAVLEDGDFYFYEFLTPRQQICLRHALFLSPGVGMNDDITLNLLQRLKTRNTAVVTGSHGWFVRQTITKLQKELSEWSANTGNKLIFKACALDAEEVSIMRQAVVRKNPKFKKTKNQSVISHTVDALCAYARASNDAFVGEFMGADPALASIASADRVASLHSGNCDVIRIERKAAEEKDNPASRPIFKEGLLGENFLPVTVKDGKIFIGFDGDRVDNGKPNRIELVLQKAQKPESFLQLLEAFFDKPVDYEMQKKTTYRIDKRKAFAFLGCGEKPKDKVGETLKNVLQSLMYLTVRKDIVDSIVPADEKKYASEESLLKRSSFEIIFDFWFFESKIKGSLELPAKRDWKKLLSSPEIASRLGQLKDDFDFAGYISDLRGIRQNSAFTHKRCRRVFSLPTVVTPSGVVHIQRKNIHNEEVGQAQSTYILYAGFHAVDGAVDWKRLVHLPVYHSKNLSIFAEKEDGYFEFIPMSEWRQVSDGDVRIWLCPATKGRRYVRVNISWPRFLAWTNADALGYKAPSDLPHEVKLPGYSEIVPEKFRRLFGTPRNRIFIERVGERIQFSYEDASRWLSLKEAYNAVGSSASSRWIKWSE